MVIAGRRVVCGDGLHAATIHLSGGRIARVGAGDEAADIDVGNLVISPGVVDTHVHVNEPGRAEWEGFDTATRAAAAGGVTTIVDMPLNSVPATTTVAALEVKRSAARGQCHVDVAFWGGVVPGNAGELDALVDAGVRGFKCFLAPSGVDEFPAVTESDVREALPILARRGVPLLVHAELPEFLRPAATDADRASVYSTYLATRPPAAEVAAIESMAALAREFDARVHIVHVACAEGVDAIARARASGVRISAETCPHYLTFAADQIPDGATGFKCAPPIRDQRHRDALRAGLRSGALDLVATDHSPAPPAMKCGGDFITAWGGIASLELSLAATWTTLESRSSTLNGRDSRFNQDAARIAAWMSEAPARARRRRSPQGPHCSRLRCRFCRVGSRRRVDRRSVSPAAAPQADAVCRTDASRRGARKRIVRGEQVWADGRLARAAAGQLL